MDINLINKVIRDILPNLNESDLKWIQTKVAGVIQALYASFHLTAADFHQFTQNNNRDIVAVLNFLLPYIDDKDGFELHSRIKSFEDIGSLKQKITNIAYDRYKKTPTSYEETAYTVDDIENNYKLIINTINMCSNKLFANWINILPMSIKNYTDTPAWKSAFKYENNRFTGLSIDNLFGGIHFCDVFNTLNHFLYRHVFNYKWLIYEKVFRRGERPTMYIEILDNYIPVNLLLSDIAWSELTESNRFNIQQKWNIVLSERNSDKVKSHFVQSILVHYNRYNKVSIQDITSIKIDDIYTYLKTTVIEFSETWYGKSILREDKIVNDLPSETIGGIKYYFSYKNFYNYAKNMCIQYPENYHNLTFANISDFIDALNNNVLRLTSVIVDTYGDAYDNVRASAVAISNSIERFVKSRLIKTVFECHIYGGFYTQFVPNKLLTDYRYVGDDFDTRSANMKKALKGKLDSYYDCYYYLTGKKYADLILYNNKGKQVGYFDYMLEGSSWYGYYSMDWIFQMQLYHRYLNNRIIYITGATGQGKSTQIPKLLHYAVKAFGMEFHPKIVSTQPRTKPTRDNAVFIAKEMGVPIKVFSKSIDAEVKTFNNYIQYQSKEDKSTSPYPSYIKEETDGLLLENIINKVVIKDHVIIIDEAHEHNANMDLLLTVLRHSLMSNPRLKLVITSATMDDDESTYRKYYRCIDDSVVDASQNTFPDGIDRLVVDRRVHLAPPFESARYSIKDVFLAVDPKDYDATEELGIEKVKQITRNNRVGDILFFSIGKAQIQDIVNELNTVLPPHAIALPFYREIDREWQSIFTNISSNWDKINFDRSKVFDVVTGAKVARGNYKYSQAVIVATNIAEASITIDSLKFVVDTGYYNHVYFDYKKRMSVMEIIPITEMNRIQRRGRVGRKGDGTVYYMYTQNSRKVAKKKYAICDGDFTDHIYKLLTSDTSLKLDLMSSPVRDRLTIPRYRDGGFNIETLLDPQGTFYIVHPCEDIIERDPVLGTVVREFEREKLLVYLDAAAKYKMVRGYERDSPLSPNIVKDDFLVGRVARVFESVFGDNTSSLQQYSYINTLLHSHSFKCFEQVLAIIAMLLGTNYEKFVKLQRPSQSEVLQLYGLFKEFQQFIPVYKTVVDRDNKTDREEYARWVREFKTKGAYTNMWNKIRLDKEAFFRIHEDDVNYRDFNKLDYKGLMKYLSGRSNSEKIEIFAESFIKRYFRLMDIVNNNGEVFATNFNVIRSDKLEDNIHKSFLYGFPLNVIRIADNKIKLQSAMIRVEFPYNRNNHNIMAPYGTFIYLANFPRDDNEPTMLAQVNEDWLREVPSQTGGGERKRYVLRKI